MDSLEKQLICPICLEMFTKPVVILPCQHNLCRKCANDIFQASNPYLSTRSGSTVTSGGRFRCPSCRHEVVLDRHGVYGLQRNLLVENIIDMYKQETTRPEPPPETKCDQPRCEEHEEEKINIYCVTCGVPTCSLCKVFGAHKNCEVAPLDNVFQKQKGELTDCIAMLVGNNDRIQAIISQLEETSRTVDENGRRQKSKVCEKFDNLYTILEERKGEMTLKINAEQEEKLDYIRGLKRRYTDHLESMAKVVETGIQTMEESEMALFLQIAKPLLQKITEGTNTSHLDKLERGYENMDHYTTNFGLERRALLSVDFVKDDEEDDDDEGEERGGEVGEGRALNDGTHSETSHAAGGAVVHPPKQQQQAAPSQLTPVQPQKVTESPSTTPTQALQQTPSLPPTQTQTKAPTQTQFSPADSPTQRPSDMASQQNESQQNADDKDGPRHVFSFSWLNTQK